tara:strand:- start:1575 stop:1712 length:138 start_codon:yes stop_codon:yes gene_type:complete
MFHKSERFSTVALRGAQVTGFEGCTCDTLDLGNMLLAENLEDGEV